MSSDLQKGVKEFFTLDFKRKRDDSITDQYSRILMVRIMLAAVLITGLNWHNDDISCIVPEALVGKDLSKYVKASCWINGFYIYNELKGVPGFQGYYGIPTLITHNGTFNDFPSSSAINERTCVATGYNPGCVPMTKEFYLQYQYFPFLLAVLGILYYLPYVCFYRVNSDLLSLKDSIEKEKPDYDEIVATYFGTRFDQFSHTLRIGLNVLIKCLYLIMHIVVFHVIDYVTNGNFRGFFEKWMDWSMLSNVDAHNYVGVREYIKPGENMLPTFGYCDVLEEAADVKHVLLNEHRFLCEISQNVVYHYVLLAVWVFLIVGMVVSSFGIIEAIFRLYYPRKYLTGDEVAASAVYPMLTVRQRQYIDYIHKMNMERYGEVLRKLFAKFHPDLVGTKKNEENDLRDEKQKQEEEETKV